MNLTGKELIEIGYPQGPVISIVKKVMEENYNHHTKEETMELLKEILANPTGYADDAVLALIAQQLVKKVDETLVAMSETPVPYAVYGADQIEEGATRQMQIAAHLPVAVAGALMPDAHYGYGLPIGGVLAVKNAVIPYGVGVDIGCRMCLSIFDINPQELVEREAYFVRELHEATIFGAGREFKDNAENEVIDSPLFKEIALLKTLQAKAFRQLGTSSSGNHFVEFGSVEITEFDEILGVAPGIYVGLLSHSGSRALGANIADYYTKVAKQKRKLPDEAANLAWLNLDEQEGMEYWLAMNLAGDYASACHHIIHAKIARQLGRQPLKMVENHHNFAWKEMYNGEEVIVHRKGATPAGKNVLGVIPGSMTAPGFIVKGKGEMASINSASHGAGRQMSRTKAINNITKEQLANELQKHGVKLLGGGLDEAPFAYKNIELVMQAQTDLVDIVGKFLPKIVKMDGAETQRYKKKKQAILGE